VWAGDIFDDVTRAECFQRAVERCWNCIASVRQMTESFCAFFLRTSTNKDRYAIFLRSYLYYYSTTHGLWRTSRTIIQFEHKTIMATADLCDVPEIHENNMKRAADDNADAETSTKKSKTCDYAAEFANRIRSAPNWITNASDATFHNVTKPQSRRSLFVLKAKDGSEQFCCIGKVMNCRLSAEALSAPPQFEGGSDEHTDLELHLTMREANLGSKWPTYNEDTQTATNAIAGMRDKAIQEAFVPLFCGDAESVNGLSTDKLNRYRKNKKKPEKITETLQDNWGGTGMNGNQDILRFKRRCYNTNDLSKPQVFIDKWLQVMDENGDSVDYISDPTAIEQGDTVLVWYRTIAQCCANNFHISLEPRAVMRVAKASSGSDAEGSFGFAAALAKARARDGQEAV